MSAWDTSLPAVMSELHRLPFDYANGDGIDFEPFERLLPSAETSAWFQAWTGNSEANGAELRIFGRDGSGGYAAYWLVVADKPILEQPIVFIGSEGEIGVVAATFDEYLWLLAGGIGPYEAVAYPQLDREPDPSFTQFAREHSSVSRMPPAQIMAKAREIYPEFRTWMESLCR